MIDLRTLVEMIGPSPAAISRDWLNTMIGAQQSPNSNYRWDWTLPGQTAETVGFRPAMSLEAAEQEIDAAGSVEAAIDRRRERAAARSHGAVAVVPIRGVIIPRPNIFELFGLATSVQTIVRLTRAAVQDPEVKAVVQAFHSPGGSTNGVTEGFAELHALRGEKPIVAVAEYLMASAAYELAVAADDIAASPSALVGSIGVLMLHVDFSRMLEAEGIQPTFIHAGAHKVEGNPYEPLGEEARAHYQALVDDAYGHFVGDVAKGRGVAPAVVRGETFGQGRVLTAEAARTVGMIDRVRTLAQTFEAYGVQTEPAPARERASALARREREVQNMERDINPA